MTLTGIFRRLGQWWQQFRDEERRQQHIQGRDCSACCIDVSRNGSLSRSTRSILWYCEYDIPERRCKCRQPSFKGMLPDYPNDPAGGK